MNTDKIIIETLRDYGSCGSTIYCFMNRAWWQGVVTNKNKLKQRLKKMEGQKKIKRHPYYKGRWVFY